MGIKGTRGPGRRESDQPLLGVATRDGELVTIQNVEAGLACRCVCPACGSRLVAKKGDVRVHHFAHDDTTQCRYAAETVAHLLAKEFLASNRLLTLPPVYWKPATGEILYPFVDVAFISATVEHRTGHVVPDVVLRTSEGRELFVEVAVTHFADNDKVQRLIQVGVSTVEIALGRCDSITREAMQRAFATTTGDKVWLYNTKAAEFRRQVYVSALLECAVYTRIPRYYGFFPRFR